MEADELMDDDLFADLYGDDEPPKTSQPAPEPAKPPAPPVAAPAPTPAAALVPATNGDSSSTTPVPAEPAPAPTLAAPQKAVDPRAPPPPSSSATPQPQFKAEDPYAADIPDDYSGWDAAAAASNGNLGYDAGSYDGSGSGNGFGDVQGASSPAIKEDGKMFIGGLNWETTDESLKEYFSQYGEVTECTVMRDGPTGRSRGFGFLTFKDPKTVNIVMVKEHYLDGKIIDPKRAIPRDEQEKTSKIFVGGVSQDATEADFREYFTQFGRVLDATLMMDKDTGRPRGFGFVTFDSEGAVENALNCPTLAILDKPIEVKKAQPRGNVRERMNAHFEDRDDRPSFRDRDNRRDRFDNNRDGNTGNFSGGQQGQDGQSGQNIYNGISPAMMAQYYQNMQRYMQAMQSFGRGGPVPAMNPALIQQMQALQAMARGGGGMPTMNPAMMQQVQQMQQMQMQQQQGGQGQMGAGSGMQQGPQGGYGGGGQNAGTYGGGNQGPGSYDGGPSYNDMQSQQGHYRQQRGFQHHPSQRDYQPPQTQPSSWEGMYDDVPPQPGRVGMEYSSQRTFMTIPTSTTTIYQHHHSSSSNSNPHPAYPPFWNGGSPGISTDPNYHRHNHHNRQPLACISNTASSPSHNHHITTTTATTTTRSSTPSSSFPPNKSHSEIIVDVNPYATAGAPVPPGPRPNGSGFDGPPPNAPTGPRNPKGSGSNYRGGGRGGAVAGRGDRNAGYGGYRGGYHPYARS